MTRNRGRIWFLTECVPAAAFFCLFSGGALSAGSGAGTTAANFLKIPVAVIPAALGESYTAMVGPDSILYNPAGLGLLGYSSFSGSHNQYLDEITQEYAVLTYRSKFGTIGAGFSMLSSGQFTAYDKDDMIIGKTSTSHRFWTLSYAQSWPHFNRDIGKLDPMLITPSWTRVTPVPDYRPKNFRVALGGSVKRVSEKLDKMTAGAYTMDAGAMLILPGHFHLGVSALNLGGRQKFFAETYKLPGVLRAGAAKDFHSINDIIIVTAASDVIKYSDAPAFNTVGLETDVLRMFQLRVGYTSHRDIGSRISGGFGMNFDRFTDKAGFIHGLRVDYAYLDYGDLGPTQRIGMQLIW
ncbi:MAG: hypothetical protein A2X28_02670 [Elusimicrobia bacterium GWA2_56_46]|nr:MAG: hypothetical protein A2X28_02670 [Elusimicrobia bacterium GWA2_56_46]OGR55335.1 MAG: hypothetical protein A2X39_00295 [Elusimicrobia bacterium GWC2_56_31]HBB67581.1 hypothetical protein [Elusimicrobiota bacterium]HBW23129.1 hypothetical protein [Elusimicrobiota bacterium]